MTEEKFNEIKKILEDLNQAKTLLDSLEKNSRPSNNLTIEVDTPYSDMGHTLTNSVSVNGELAGILFRNIMDIATEYYAKKKEEFENI